MCRDGVLLTTQKKTRTQNPKMGYGIWVHINFQVSFKILVRKHIFAWRFRTFAVAFGCELGAGFPQAVDGCGWVHCKNGLVRYHLKCFFLETMTQVHTHLEHTQF